MYMSGSHCHSYLPQQSTMASHRIVLTTNCVCGRLSVTASEHRGRGSAKLGCLLLKTHDIDGNNCNQFFTKHGCSQGQALFEQSWKPRDHMVLESRRA